MLKQQARIIAAGVFVWDLALVGVAFLAAYWLRNSVAPSFAPGLLRGHLYPLQAYLPLLPLAILVWAPLLWYSGRYRSHRTVPILQEALAVIRVCATAAVAFALILYVFRLDEWLLGRDRISRSWILLFATLACLLLLSEKLALRLSSRYFRTRGFNYRTVLIVCTNDSARAITAAIDALRFGGYRILGFVTHDVPPPQPLLNGYPVLGGVADLSRVLREQVADEVIFAISRQELDQFEDLFLALQEQGIVTRFAIDLFPHTQAEMTLEELDGVPLLTFATGPNSPLQLMAKRVIDLAVASLVLFLAMPVIGLVALAIKITSGGGVLFRQTRCGLNGRTFTLYKFRTMVADAEEMRDDLLHLNEMKGPVFKLKNDPRVTLIGRFLRRFSLDEIPQLWNVLRGDMSLVGPRPPIPEEVARYERWQRRRLAMKPGLTCLWQISGRNEIDFDRWMQLDLEYIDNWTPLLDLKILLRTIPAVLSGRGAH